MYSHETYESISWMATDIWKLWAGFYAIKGQKCKFWCKCSFINIFSSSLSLLGTNPSPLHSKAGKQLLLHAASRKQLLRYLLTRTDHRIISHNTRTRTHWRRRTFGPVTKREILLCEQHVLINIQGVEYERSCKNSPNKMLGGGVNARARLQPVWRRGGGWCSHRPPDTRPL